MSVVSDEDSPVASLSPSAGSNSTSSQESIEAPPPDADRDFEVERPDLDDAESGSEDDYDFDQRFLQRWAVFARSTPGVQMLVTREAHIERVSTRITEIVAERIAGLPRTLSANDQTYHDGTFEQRRQIYRSSPRYVQLVREEHSLILWFYRITLSTDILREWLARRWCQQDGHDYGEFVRQIYGEEAACHHHAREVTNHLHRNVGEAEVPNTGGNQWIRDEWVRHMEAELTVFEGSVKADPAALLDHSDTGSDDSYHSVHTLASGSTISLDDDESNPYPDIPHFADGPHTVSLADTEHWDEDGEDVLDSPTAPDDDLYNATRPGSPTGL